jgi:archaeosine-15-forming tRNA-guanine transglycosylase
VVIIEGVPPPWRETALHSVISTLIEEPKAVILLSTPIGLLPYSLEDVSPWCHIDCSDDTWSEFSDVDDIIDDLAELGLDGLPVERRVPGPVPESNPVQTSEIRNWLDRCTIVDKLSVLNGISPIDGCKITEGMVSRRSRTDRMINVHSNDEHIISPRLMDGAISLTLAGARRLNMLNSQPPLEFGEEFDGEEVDHPGIARVLLRDDAIPFVGVGRNVMHGYVLGADPHLIPGQPCLVVDSEGNLVAHGIAVTGARDMAFLSKGIAVRVRDGALKED